MNTCFSSSLKPLFLQLFSKCRFTFCLVCGCYFRNVSCGAPPTYPALMCAHHTRINVHARAPHPALNHSPQSFHCLSMENLGFWLVVLSPHSTSSTACLFSTCLDWGENFFFFLINFNKGTFSIWFFPLPEYSLHEQKRIAGGEQSFSLYFKVSQCH